MTSEGDIEMTPTVLQHDLVKNNEKTFLSMTSLTVAEFNNLLESFEKTLNKFVHANFF